MNRLTYIILLLVPLAILLTVGAIVDVEGSIIRTLTILTLGAVYLDMITYFRLRYLGYTKEESCFLNRFPNRFLHVFKNDKHRKLSE